MSIRNANNNSVGCLFQSILRKKIYSYHLNLHWHYV